MLSTDIFEDSWLYKDGKAAGLTEGKAEGKAEGKLDGQREALRTVFELRFPQAPIPPQFDSLSSLDNIQRALRFILEAATAQEATTAIERAAKS